CNGLSETVFLRNFKVNNGTRIIAAHLHHGIRGEEANRDEAFCRQLCEALDVPLVVKHADIPAIAAESGESLETVARRVRYEFFLRVMTDRHIPTLLTAHHADDNLETVLDRLLRGSGTKGMGGIPPTRVMGELPDGTELTVVRPLLEWTKKDILTACTDMGLDYVTDSTNLEAAYTRNRLRHTVIPALESLAGEGIPQRTATRLTRAAREDEECLMGLAEARVDGCISADRNGIKLECLRGSYPALSKRMMAILYERVTAQVNPRDGSGTLAAAHLDALCELIQKGIPESSVTLPRGMEARVRGEWLYIRPAEGDTPSAPTEPIPLPVGYTPWGEDITVLVEVSPTPLVPSDGEGVWASAVFPSELPLPLLARKREAGDEILSHGMHKKLKKLLCDKNIPPHLRDRIPLICLPDGSPLWYPAAAFRDGYPAPKEGSCIRITVFVEMNRQTLEN
ncbi:MAG: tRNA lysidine(34) synthetase TilS, partial [Clostridia bacterium]|nr:tRNA lysidine(34) synthetase TilS [Clostridia bacterium]